MTYRFIVAFFFFVYFRFLFHFSFVLSSYFCLFFFFFFSSRRRHTRCLSDWSSDVCSSDLVGYSWPFAPTMIGCQAFSPAGPCQARTSQWPPVAFRMTSPT